jgi:hypothetical protein
MPALSLSLILEQMVTRRGHGGRIPVSQSSPYHCSQSPYGSLLTNVSINIIVAIAGICLIDLCYIFVIED